MSNIKEGQLVYDVSEKVREMFAVEGFNPREYLRISELNNGKTMTKLDVAVQVLWFQLCKEDGRIITIPHEVTRERAVFQAQVYFDDSDQMKANGYATCYLTDDPDFGRSFVELAETFAVGRALKRAGFGSQFCDLTGINDPDPGETGNPVEPDAGEGTPEDAQTSKKPARTRGAAAKSAEVQTGEAPEGGQEPEAPKEFVLDESLPVEEMVKIMPVEYAMKIIIPFGFQSGKTLGQVSLEKPKSLEYYLKQDNCSNRLKAGVRVLLDTALKKAG